MNKKAQSFLKEIRTIGYKAILSSDKSFVIYEPSLPNQLIQIAIDLTDELCKLLDNEQLLLSNDDANLINSLIDNNVESSSFHLINSQMPDETLPIVYEEYTTESFDKDFDFIRKNLKDVIASGTTALNRMILVAHESQHPRSYEVVATLMKALSDINKDLLDSHKKKYETNMLKGTSNITNNQTNNTQNIIFSGSTSELAKLLKNKKD
jgi:hypothetical protein